MLAKTRLANEKDQKKGNSAKQVLRKTKMAACAHGGFGVFPHKEHNALYAPKPIERKDGGISESKNNDINMK